MNIVTDTEGTVLMWSECARPTPPEGGHLIELTAEQAAAFNARPPNEGIKFSGGNFTFLPLVEE